MVVVACIPDPVITGRPDGGPPPVDGGQPPTGKTADELARAWSGCLSLDNFKLANMATAWGTLAATNGQACSSCHGTGLQGFYADRDENGMFTAISTMKAFMLTYFSPDVAHQTMIVNEALFQAAASGQPPFDGHPPFDPKTNAGMTALRSFYTLTQTRQQANTCDPARFP
jgi:hypothetical protein